MQIQQLYESILNSVNLVADEHGLISVRNDENELRPVMIDDQRLTLPLPEILRSGDWGNRIAFHPLSENVMRGPSPVIEKLVAAIRVRLTYSLSGLLFGLVDAAADRSRHASINPKAAAFLETMPEADEKSLDAMIKILQAADSSSNQRLISIYLKRGGTFNGQRVARLARITFPILKEFERTDGTVFGVKLRKKDQIGFKELLKYLLPDADEVETYSGVGSSNVAPWFQALMDGYIKVARQLNSIIHLQRKQLADEEFLHIDLNWTEHFDEFEKYRDLIPPLAGNEGSLLKDEPTFKAQGNLNFTPPKTTEGPTIVTPAKAAALVAASPLAKDEPVTPGDFNPNFSLALKEEEQKQKAALTQQWSQWQQQSGVVMPDVPVAAVPAPKSAGGEKRGLDFNKVMASRFQGPQLTPYGAPQQMAYTVPVAPVLPGTYAGRHRGVAVNQFGGYGQPMTFNNHPSNPPWVASPSPMQGGFGGFGMI